LNGSTGALSIITIDPQLGANALNEKNNKKVIETIFLK
jgi:hypothetical protein